MENVDLTELERKVLILHYGLDDLHQHSLREVAQQLHLSPEQVRQIEVQALIKLKILGLKRPIQGEILPCPN